MMEEYFEQLAASSFHFNGSRVSVAAGEGSMSPIYGTENSEFVNYIYLINKYILSIGFVSDLLHLFRKMGRSGFRSEKFSAAYCEGCLG